MPAPRLWRLSCLRLCACRAGSPPSSGRWRTACTGASCARKTFSGRQTNRRLTPRRLAWFWRLVIVSAVLSASARPVGARPSSVARLASGAWGVPRRWHRMPGRPPRSPRWVSRCPVRASSVRGMLCGLCRGVTRFAPCTVLVGVTSCGGAAVCRCVIWWSSTRRSSWPDGLGQTMGHALRAASHRWGHRIRTQALSLSSRLTIRWSIPWSGRPTTTSCLASAVTRTSSAVAAACS